ncbi:prolipoprotein diacylglyceryl transferase [Fulvivirga sp. RKSG066]|nr:prolipoprotein diacylglyceryl transferase [Fulvivirga aurantia]MTI22396.1 prolipoprotein diacylglyceryl transferase [Fulvivirga aurantia]
MQLINSYIHWNPDPEIINIFGLSIRYYGLFFAGGILLCVNILSWMFKKEKLLPENLDKLTTYCVIGIVVGARLGHCLFYEPSHYLNNPIDILKIWQGGLASHGGVLGLLLAMYLYSRKTRHSMIHVADLITVVAGLSFALIRLGNFMNSEIVGLPTTKPWGVVFEKIDLVPRHPAQLYEAISYLIIFGILMILYKTKRESFKNGFFFGLGCILFFSARLLIELTKVNQVAFEEELTLNMGQLLSIPFILIGIVFVIRGLRKTKESSSYS